MKTLWTLLIIAGVAVMAMSAFHFSSRISKGDVAPDFVLETLDGAKVSLSEFKGKKILIHFWASWCGICVQEFPAFEKFANSVDPDKLVILAVSLDAKKTDVQKFFGGHVSPFRILLDSQSKTADLYSSYSVPESFLVDPTGVIMWRRDGPIDWDDDSYLKKKHLKYQ